MSKNMKVEVVEAEVVDEGRAVAVVKTNEGEVVKAISRQIETMRKFEVFTNFARLQIGASVGKAVKDLGIESKGGRNDGGLGVKGWWERNFKGEDGKPVISYVTVTLWRKAAENLPSLMGADGKNAKKILELLAKDPEMVFKSGDKKILKSVEDFANNKSIKQMCLWGEDEEPARKGGRKAGSKANSSEVDTHIAKTAAEKAAAAEQEMREIVGTLGAFLTRGGKINLLTAQAKSDFHTALVDYAKLLEEQM